VVTSSRLTALCWLRVVPPSWLTDPEIAEQLFITTKTASNHAANILAKFGAVNRRQAAALAVQHGLG
jgi:ATP/maltotriose-dependent transcriptional regulator MalT